MEPPNEPHDATSDAPSAPWILIAVVMVIGVFALWAYNTVQADRALVRLPDVQRHAIVRRAMENLRTVCHDGSRDDLRDFCQGQAAIAIQAGECNAECRSLAAEWSIGVTR
jgi:hypothetical protein